MGLELLMRELNPKHDLARHTYDYYASFLNMFKDTGIALVN